MARLVHTNSNRVIFREVLAIQSVPTPVGVCEDGSSDLKFFLTTGLPNV
jgi:hypothetical protein